MPITETTESELIERADAALLRFTELARSVDPRLPLRDSDWTAGDVVAHLLSVAHRYTHRDFTQQEGLVSADALAAANADQLALLSARSVPELLEQLAGEAEAWKAMSLPLDQLFPFHAGQQVDGASARCNWIAELTVHGWDLARAAKRPWPIEGRDALLILRSGFQVAPGWVDERGAAGVDLHVEIRARGGRPQAMVFDDGTLVVRDRRPGDKPDAVLVAPPGALVLQFYGRISLVQAVRRGVLVVGGRRPWKAFSLPSLIRTP